MAYEWRKGHLYYYTKVRKNGHVRSEYGGPAASEITRLGAQLDTLTRTRRALEQMDAEDERAQWDALAAPPPELLALEAAARSAIADALCAAGYHQHKREWRKRRVEKDETAPAGAAGPAAGPAD